MITQAQGFTGAPTIITTCLTVAGIAVFSGVAYWLQNRRRTTPNAPTKWKPIGTVQQLFMYPLKSGHCLELKEAECTTRGFKEINNNAESDKLLLTDRGFIIYQEDSQKFMTARQKNAILLIKVSSNSDGTVTLSSSKSDVKTTFKVTNSASKNVQCSVHDNEIVDAQDCGDEVALWLSKVILGKDVGLRLGFHSKLSRQRQLDSGLFKNYIKVYKNFTENDLGTYSDLASYMVMSQSSLDDLNSRLEAEDRITCRNFRPNVVVSGPEIPAYDEDKWQWIKIGENVILKGFKPCTRCIMVTLDPDKGQASLKKEPFITLKKYRQVTDPATKEIEGSSPVFGRYCGLYENGNIYVGDTVYLPA